MSIRCGCPNEGDAIVFGERHECTADPSLAERRPIPWWKPRPYEHVLSTDEVED